MMLQRATGLHILSPKISRLLLRIATPFLILPLVLSGQARKQASSAPSADASVTYKQGITALKKGDLDGAHNAFEKVLRLNPRNAEAHDLLGWVLLTQGQTDSAIAHYRQAIQLKPSLADAHINLANALAQKHDLEDALQEAQTAVQLFPNHADAYRTLGRILSFRGDLQGATNALKKAIE